MPRPPPPAFQPLTGLYEPSAIVQLPDGRFLVVEDEPSHPLHLVAIDAAGGVVTTELTASLLQLFDGFWELADLEGLTLDRAGQVYGVTSHSRDGDGRRKKSRDKLVRFRIEGQRVVEPRVCEGLKKALVKQHPVLAQAEQARDVKAGGGLNIEALEMSPDQSRLLIGLRGPLHDGLALMASVENPQAIFDSDAAPQIGQRLEELDLGGSGIRGLSYMPALGAYLVIGGPTSREAAEFSLWQWSGEPGATPHRLTVPGLKGLAKAEGLCPAIIGGEERLVIVSDDGDRAARRPAGYLVLDPALLQAAA